MALKGKFRPTNPNKYKGDPSNIIYRSSWELKLMSHLDRHPDVLEWSSEEIIVPYRSPLDRKIHRYFPDFWVKRRSATDGSVEVIVIEVKPLKETMEPKPQTKMTKRYLREVATWGVNQAKWKAAEEFCKDRNWKFIKMTEQQLGIK
jgi:hypothetical protein